ncbi:MAG: peptide chain release factor N(5)-glutamine methyltransferase [Muribaculaceae bacterium]|nr:peptide chain release factor N(5)-glutamine methyltransferase [Muribaculaceae bacterium]MDE6093705.1 peptide chain release factor N(5)-glutamine methyltransferase [Muribaculaceae bacterium]
MTVSEIYRRLRQAAALTTDNREATAIARCVMEAVAHMQPADLVTRGDEEVMPATLSRLDKTASRLAEGEPVQYILGEAWFHGLRLHVEPGVLIPRPETSQLVDILTDMAGDRTDLDIIDLGTGSGAIAISLARSLRFPNITAVDISPDAIRIAGRNASDLGVKISFAEADMLKEESLPRGPWDIVVSNPPYIAPAEAADMERRVLDYEPHIALFAPEGNPLCFYRAAARYAALTLKNGGVLAFEINPDYADDLKTMLGQAGFHDVEIQRDFCGRRRFAIARL